MGVAHQIVYTYWFLHPDNSQEPIMRNTCTLKDKAERVLRENGLTDIKIHGAMLEHVIIGEGGDGGCCGDCRSWSKPTKAPSHSPTKSPSSSPSHSSTTSATSGLAPQTLGLII